MRAVKAATLNLLALGDGKTGVFKVRQKELDADDYGQTILEETRKLNVGLGISVQQLVDGVQKETDAATWQARQEISLATMVMLGARRGDAARLGAVRLALCRPQHPAPDPRPAALDAGAVERRPRIGDLSDSGQQDEIAEMAKSLQVFRESMIQSRALSAEQDKDRIAKAERASRMEARIVEFEATVRTRARQPAGGGRFDADDRAEHVGDRRSVQRAGERGGVRRRGDLGQRADRVVGHRGIVVVDRGDRPPGRHLVGNRPQGGRRKPAPPTPPCRDWPTTPPASASWST